MPRVPPRGETYLVGCLGKLIPRHRMHFVASWRSVDRSAAHSKQLDACGKGIRIWFLSAFGWTGSSAGRRYTISNMLRILTTRDFLSLPTGKKYVPVHGFFQLLGRQSVLSAKRRYKISNILLTLSPRYFLSPVPHSEPTTIKPHDHTPF